jgi:catechol 2,3-dioxygenase-like lactoylglutathione lyase family enzyme
MSSTPPQVALRFEVTVIPVADADRAKAFYAQLGWRLDADLPITDTVRIVQFTPPGSPASIQFGDGLTEQPPGSARDLMLIVDDLDAARDELNARGAGVGEIWHGPRGVASVPIPGRDPNGGSYTSYASFTDPDGNAWLLQEITERLPGRV